MVGREMRPWLTVLIAAVAIPAFSGCGGSSSSSASHQSASTQPVANVQTAFAARVEAICTRHNHAAAAASVAARNEAEIKDAMRKRLAIEQATLSELGSVTVPASMLPAWEGFLAGRKTLIGALRTLAREGFAGKGTTAALQAAGVGIDKIIAAAKQTHLTQCALQE